MANSLRLPSLQELRVRNFSGGVNLRDAQAELAPIESPDSWNATLDERGAVSKRLGYTRWNSSVFTGGLTVAGYHWAAKDVVVVQTGANVTVGDDTTVRHTWTTSAAAAFVDFNDVLYAVHPVDGLWKTSDGGAWSKVSDAAAPKGVTLEAWQNRLYVAGADGPRVWWSKIGDADTWTIPATPVADDPGWVDLREKDSQSILRLAGASGIDIAGRPGLLAFKQDSTYRINDSTTGAYTTLDTTIGAASTRAVVNVPGAVYVLSRHGIFATDGVGPLKNVSAQEAPLWTASQIDPANLDLWCAGMRRDRVYFSLCRAGGSANDLAIEHHPAEGWIVFGSNTASFYVTVENGDDLLTGSPTVDGRLYRQGVGGSDDGQDIASYFQTRWYEPAAGLLTRMRRLRVIGRGNFTLYRRLDYTYGQGVAGDVSIPVGGFVWGAPGSTWGGEGVVWGPTAAQAYFDMHSLGTCKAVSFRIEETSSIVATGPPILGRQGQQAGAWSLFGLDLLYVPLGTA